MELGMLRVSLICFLAVIVSGAEEPIKPPHTEEKLTIAKLEEADHGPLMKALLAPGENSTSQSQELQREKRHKGYDGQRGTWKKKGGCYGGCGGGYNVQPVKVIVVPVITKSKRKGGGCGGGYGCGGGGGGYGGVPIHNKYPSGGGYCNTCGGGGGGGGSYSYSQSSSSAGSWGGKK